MAHVSIGLDCDRSAVPLQGDYSGVPSVPVLVRNYVDDSILVEVCLLRDGRCLGRAVDSIASDYFWLLSLRGSSNVLLITWGVLECVQARGWRFRHGVGMVYLSEKQTPSCGNGQDLWLLQDSSPVNALELLGIVTTAFVLLLVCGKH